MPRESLIDKFLWAVITSMIGMAVHYIGNISENIVKLNEKIALVIARVEYHEVRLSKLEIQDGHGKLSNGREKARP